VSLAVADLIDPYPEQVVEPGVVELLGDHRGDGVADRSPRDP
jgi:hypothetical protein